MKKIKIVSVGKFLPDQVVKSDHLFEEIRSDKNYGIPINWLSKRVGIIERRVGSSDATPIDHALPAVEIAIQRAGIDRRDIGIVIFCGIERESHSIATAQRINIDAGLNSNFNFDIGNACFGFFESVSMAVNLINQGEAKYALIATGEISTQVMYQAVENLKKGLPKKDARNIIGALTVGDAGGAIILGESESDQGFRCFWRITDSNHYDKCMYRRKESGEFEGQMLMGPISQLFNRFQSQLVEDSRAEFNDNSDRWVISHQVGKRPFEKLRDTIGASDREMIKTFPRLGNLTTATMAVNLDQLFELFQPQKDDQLMGCFGGSGVVAGLLSYRF